MPSAMAQIRVTQETKDTILGVRQAVAPYQDCKFYYRGLRLKKDADIVPYSLRLRRSIPPTYEPWEQAQTKGTSYAGCTFRPNSGDQGL